MSHFTVPGYATLYKGEWYEPGRMGWWGMSSETPQSQKDYWTEVNLIIDNVGDDTLFTVVDAHI